MGNTIKWANGSGGGTPMDADTMNEPFEPRSASIASGTLSVVIGPGRIDTSDSAAERLGEIAHGSTVTPTLGSAAFNTDYYVYVKSNNNRPMTGADFTIKTSAIPGYGEFRLAKVHTPAADGAATVTDLRGLFAAAGMGGVSPGGANPPFKIFVQASDPGAAAANGDLWVQTS